MEKLKKWIEILAESANYIIMSFALSYMSLVFAANPLRILFLASDVWLIGEYWKKIFEITKNKIFSRLLFALCFAAHEALIYFYWFGRGK